jgi:hypothetical protein
MSWFRKKQRTGPPSGILLVSSGGLGDTILMSLVIERFTSLADPGEEITLVLPRESLKMAFLFDKKIIIQPVDYKVFRKTKSYVREITDQLYDANFRLVISTDFLRHPKLDEAIIKSCVAEEVVAMEPRSWPKYDKALKKNRALYDRLYDSGPTHMDKVVRWAKFADWLTGTKAPPPQIRLSAGQVKASEEYSRPTVILVPFSAVKEKQSPPEVFLTLMEHLKDDYDFVIAGAPKDLENNPEFMGLMNLPNVSFDDSVFEKLAPRLKNARLVISVDTATMHLAVALGAPTVCLASAAYVNEITPYAPEITPDNVRFVYQPMDCEGCLGSCHLPTEAGRFPCVARIEMLQILKAVDELLER